MKAFIRLGQYFNPNNPPKGATILSYDDKTGSLEIINKNNKSSKFNPDQSIAKDIPTKLSQLQNDTQFITLDDIDLDDIKQQLKDYTDSKISRVFTYKGAVQDISQLPEDANIGDVYTVGNSEYAYIETGWQELGPLFDLSIYATVTYVNQQLEIKANASDVYNKEAADAKFLTEHQDISGKADIDSVYTKEQADAKFLTEHQDISGKANVEDVYSKEQADEKFLTEHQDISAKANIEDVYSKEQADTKFLTEHQDISAKANIADVYSKVEADQKFLTEHQNISGKANIEDVYSKEQADAKFLTEHQSLDAYATKEDISELISEQLDPKFVAVSGEFALKSEIPTNISDLINDAGYLTEHQNISGKANVEDVYSKEEADAKFLTEHQDISGKANIADVYSKEAADAKFLTDHQSLAEYAKSTDVLSAINTAKTQLQQQFSGAFHFKGQLNNESELDQLKNVSEGDVYQIGDAEYAYNGTQFIKLGFNIDLSEYAKTSVIPTKVSDLQNDSGYLTTHQDISGKANVADVYSKIEADNKFLTEHQNLDEYATKAEISGLISEEVDPKFVAVSGEFATKEQVNTLSSNIDEQFIDKDIDILGQQAASGYISKVGQGDLEDVKSEAIILSGDAFSNQVGKMHSVYSKLTNYSFELGVEKTDENTDGNMSTSQMKDVDQLKAISKKLFTINIGSKNVVSGMAAIATGKGSQAKADYAVAHGYGAKAYGAGSHGEGRAIANGSYTHAEGQNSQANNQYSHAEGYETRTNGDHSHAEGGMYTLDGVPHYSETYGKQSHSEGVGVTYGQWSHAEGCLTMTAPSSLLLSSDFSHAEGYFSTTYAHYSHAEGGNTKTYGRWSHAEGNSAVTSGEYAHAQGQNTKAIGENSHSEGYGSISYDKGAHAQGDSTHAIGQYAHAEGYGTKTAEAYQHVEGKINIPLTGYQHIVGGGTISSPKNIQTLDWNGNEWNAGTVTAADFITQNDKLSEKANTLDVLEINDKVSLNAAQIGAIALRLSVIEDKVDDLKKTNTQVIAVSNNQTISINNDTTDYIIAGQMNKNISAKAKTLQFKNTEINIPASTTFNTTGGNALFLDVKDQVEIKQSNVQMNYSQSSNCIKVVNANTLIIKDTTFTGNTYNTLMTGQNCTSGFLKYMLIDNCNFDQTASHVNIWFAGHEDNAILTISNCHFKSAEQFLYLGDFANANNKLTVNIINCTIDNYDHSNSSTYGYDYAGIIIIESRNIGTYEQLVAANPYGNGKVTFNIDNLIVNGKKVTKDNFIIGSGNADQLLYYYHQQSKGTLGTGGSGCIPFNQETKNLFPIFNIK